MVRTLIAILLLVPSLAFAQTGSGGAGVPFGSTVQAHRGWKVTPEEAARLTREGWTRRTEPETGNEQWSKSLTHSQPSSYAVASSHPGGCADGSCGSSPSMAVLKVGGS